HLVNGVWGTLSLGLLGDKAIAKAVAGVDIASRGAQTWIQIKGIFWVGVFTLIASLIFWYIIKAVMGLRVTEEEEIEGLDIGEHGNEAYPNFQPMAEK
ncbi:MAG TPA: ammonia permease, partial [Verrucomicrobiae bacterium]|nr:ammonia permease [Verrucomicrobiae bacterium]